MLKRYDSPRAALDALFSARQRIESGELKPQLPKDATAEQLTAFRKEHGIPEKADGYLEKLPQGVELDAQDKAMIAPYLEAAHKVNASPEIVNAFLTARAAQLDKMVDEQAAADTKARSTVEDALRSEWGNDYRANINAIKNLFAGAPEGVADELTNARLPSGRAFFNSPKAVQWFANLARQLNPFGTMIGSDGGAMDQKGLDARLAEIGRWMGAPNGSADYKRYWNDPKVQAEYHGLLQAQERMKQRTAAA